MLTIRLIPPQPPVKQLIVRIPQVRGGYPDDAASKPAACIPMQQAPCISTTPQVVHLLMDHHCSPNHRQPSEQRCLGLYHRIDFSFLGLKVTKVSRVVGVVHTMWIVVAASGVTPLAQVSVLMDVHRPGLWITVCGEAIDANEDSEFFLRIFLLEQHLAIHFGQTVR